MYLNQLFSSLPFIQRLDAKMVLERFFFFPFSFFFQVTTNGCVFQMLILWYVVHYNSGVFAESSGALTPFSSLPQSRMEILFFCFFGCLSVVSAQALP